MRKLLIVALRVLRRLAGGKSEAAEDPVEGENDELSRLLLERRRLKETVALFRSFGFDALAREYNQSLWRINRKIRALRQEPGLVEEDRVSMTN